MSLIDNHGRKVDYLRLAITDRCNLRCLYCMPEEGLKWVARKDLMSYEEIEKLLFVFHNLGIKKLRFTGGEPFLRKDFMTLFERISSLGWFDSISITTNGTLTAPHVKRLAELNVHSVNLSLDTIDKNRFERISRRDDFEKVMETFHALLDHGITTKINTVIMEGKNEEDILSLAEWTKQYAVDVRFIEEMPFNGAVERHAMKWNYVSIIEEIKKNYPALVKITDESNSTSYNYHIPGHQGNIGVIAAWSRNFCGTCNRIRLTPKGVMKTCLYDEGKLDLLALLRSGAGADLLEGSIIKATGMRAKDGFEAEKARSDHSVHESMATIGG